jgi:hypothetical protein
VVLRPGMAHVPEGRGSNGRRPAGDALSAAYLSLMGDSVGTPVGVQQKLMQHADIRTNMNVYSDAATDEMTEVHSKVVGLALNGAQDELNH